MAYHRRAGAGFPRPTAHRRPALSLAAGDLLDGAPGPAFGQALTISVAAVMAVVVNTDQVRPRWPKLATLMEASKHAVLAYMAFLRQHRTKLHSTNPIERLNKEVKHRVDIVGIFPNEASILRLLGAVLFEQNDVYGPPRSCKGFVRRRRDGCLRSCIRPFGAVTRTAGLDGFRGSAARQTGELRGARIVSVALAEPRSTRDCHRRSLPSQASAAVGGADLGRRPRTARDAGTSRPF